VRSRLVFSNYWLSALAASLKNFLDASAALAFLKAMSWLALRRRA